MGLKGELYGVTQAGGTNGYGAVFELAPSGRSYAEKLIHSFDLSDGYQPGSGLTLSRSGDIYGTTLAGGDTSVCYYVGCGVVFELIRDANGDWNETVLHEMAVSDGADPLGPVVFDPSGSLYAAAQSGGAYDMGSVFRLTPTLGGNWSETVLHAFDFKFPNGEDGEHPYAGVVFEGGKVVGTAFSGGVNDSGIPVRDRAAAGRFSWRSDRGCAAVAEALRQPKEFPYLFARGGASIPSVRLFF
jgi:uncharacterized repeat protein (TIGR03803 family)